MCEYISNLLPSNHERKNRGRKKGLTWVYEYTVIMPPATLLATQEIEVDFATEQSSSIAHWGRIWLFPSWMAGTCMVEKNSNEVVREECIGSVAKGVWRERILPFPNELSLAKANTNSVWSYSCNICMAFQSIQYFESIMVLCIV